MILYDNNDGLLGWLRDQSLDNGWYLSYSSSINEVCKFIISTSPTVLEFETGNSFGIFGSIKVKIMFRWYYPLINERHILLFVNYSVIDSIYEYQHKNIKTVQEKFLTEEDVLDYIKTILNNLNLFLIEHSILDKITELVL